MHRRQFLAAGVGGATLLAGCYRGGSGEEDGPDEAPTETETPTPSPTEKALALAIAGLSEGENGVLIATVEVVNQTDTERTGTVTVTARAGDERQTVTREVTVPAGESRTVDLTFSNLTRDAFADDGGFPKATVTA